MSFAVTESRLAALGVRLGDLLTGEQRRWYAGFLSAGEYGFALEMLAEWLSEEESPLPTGARAEALSLATEMGVEERVATTLASALSSRSRGLPRRRAGKRFTVTSAALVPLRRTQ